MNQTSTKIQERLDTLINELSNDFDIEDLNNAPARFDSKKLDWFNQQYIKMLSLEEFAYRASKLKFDSRQADKNLRVGDYVYFVDSEKQMVFCETDVKPEYGVEQYYHQIGGGRAEGEDYLSNLQKEILEETEGQVTIDPSKLVPIGTFHLLLDKPLFRIDEQKEYHGKEFNVHYYEIKEDQIEAFKEYVGLPGKEYNHFRWVDINDVIGGNRYLTFPIWKEFCEMNDIPCFVPGVKIIRQLLSYRLDQMRVTTLSELGVESSCVNLYEPCAVENLQWRKSDLDTSLEALRELNDMLINNDDIWQRFHNVLCDKLQLTETDDFENLLQQAYNHKKLEQYLEFGTHFWEEKIKNYLTDSDKDFGAYLWPLRVALSGKDKSPSAFELLPILGMKETQKRIISYLK